MWDISLDFYAENEKNISRVLYNKKNRVSKK